MNNLTVYFRGEWRITFVYTLWGLDKHITYFTGLGQKEKHDGTAKVPKVFAYERLISLIVLKMSYLHKWKCHTCTVIHVLSLLPSLAKAQVQVGINLNKYKPDKPDPE